MRPNNPPSNFYQQRRINQSSKRILLIGVIIFSSAILFISAPIQAQKKNDSIPAKPASTPEPEIELPLKLIEFSAKPSNDIVVFKWSTTAEVNVNHFELEKSINGIVFTIINKQTAKGIISNTDDYKAEDFKPAAGINYYRLKFVCNDGKFSYSKIIKVKYPI